MDEGKCVYFKQWRFTRQQGNFILWKKKKVILVTGGANGIGLGTIEYLLSEKCLWTTGGIYLVDGGKSI